MAVTGDAHDVAHDEPGAVQVRPVVGYGQRRHAPVEIGRLVGGDRRDPPLAVDVHRHLTLLERVVGAALVAEGGLELADVLVPVEVDHRLLPGQQRLPGRVGTQDRPAVLVLPARAGHDPEVGQVVLVEAGQRVEADLLQAAVAAPAGQLLRVLGQLGQRLRRAGDARLGEQLLVVVQPVRVGEQRHRAPPVLVRGVLLDQLRDVAQVDVVALQVGGQVAPRAGRAELADVVGGTGQGDVGTLTGADRLGGLVVVLPCGAGSHARRHGSDMTRSRSG